MHIPLSRCAPPPFPCGQGSAAAGLAVPRAQASART